MSNFRNTLPPYATNPLYVGAVGAAMESRPKCPACLDDPEGYGRCDPCVEAAHLELIGHILCAEMFEFMRGSSLFWLHKHHADTLPYESPVGVPEEAK